MKKIKAREALEL
uniref:Uncharacterized protein n=1 Tax=Anguilla anguilla TaxID=7936 RepID=A0A0E9U4J7_ANGAN